MLADVTRFYRDARRVLDAPEPSTATLGAWMDDRGYGRGFREHFLIPITSAVWSTAADRILEFPVDYLLHFLDNHGLIGYGNAPQWRVVRGGSRAYVERILARLPRGAVRTGDPVVAVDRDACRGDRADRGWSRRPLRCRRDGDPRRRRAARSCATRTTGSGASWAPSSTRATGSSSTPTGPSCRRHPRAGASWNVRTPDCRRSGDALTMTYHMNRLQSIPGPVEYRVSLNPGDRLDPDRIVAVARCSATRCTPSGPSPRSARSARCRGRRRTWFAGAHLGYGFHEDGCRSGFEVAAMIGRADMELAA